MIGIIGGTGTFDSDVLSDVKQVKVDTPYGEPSDSFTLGKFKGRDIVIISRHGKNHSFGPGTVPYKANIDALKKLGVTKIISLSTVGSLKEEFKPGDLVFTDQFIDRTTQRESTFYDTGKIVHISAAEPFCKDIREKLAGKAKILGLRYHEKGTCVVIEGPRFSTKAESALYRSWGADTINMTLLPEAVLAREAEMCYANIAMVTDYDCWKEHAVSLNDVIRVMNENKEKVKKLLISVLGEIDDKKICSCNQALKNAGL